VIPVVACRDVGKPRRRRAEHYLGPDGRCVAIQEPGGERWPFPVPSGAAT
jgi:hypothetical protein